MKNHIQAYAVHLFTASGAVFALFAILAAGNNDWSTMFLWLLGALIVDGIDGPLARHYRVKDFAANWDGALMDLIIDYLTYVFIPAYALAQSGMLPEWEGWFAAIIITVTGVVYFSDTRMKTADNSFNGFPGCWNMVVLVLFALTPPVWVSMAIIVFLAITQFFGFKFIHPVRTVRWRPVSLAVMLAWVAIALWIGWSQFEPAPIAKTGLLVTSLYLLFAGIFQQFIAEKSKGQDQRAASDALT